MRCRGPADAFEVIVPSLPGFGYSTPTRPDMNFWKIADVWHELMTQTLGHTRYAAAGCDVGPRAQRRRCPCLARRPGARAGRRLRPRAVPAWAPPPRPHTPRSTRGR